MTIAAAWRAAVPTAGLLAAMTLAPHAEQAPRPAPAARAATSARDAAVPFAAGETLVYDVTWSNLLSAGTTTVSVRDKRASFDSTAYYITAEGQPSSLVSALYPIYYKADTLLDTRTLLPQRGSIYSDERGRKRFRITRFDHAARLLRYEVQSGEPAQVTSRDEQPLPGRAHDALSAIFALRTMALRPGATQLVPVAVNGHVYRVQMTVAGIERVTCGLGQLEAWRVTPTLVDAGDREDGRDFAVWISTDRRRLPVKLEGALPVGVFGLTLASAR